MNLIPQPITFEIPEALVESCPVCATPGMLRVRFIPWHHTHGQETPHSHTPQHTKGLDALATDMVGQDVRTVLALYCQQCRVRFEP